MFSIGLKCIKGKEYYASWNDPNTKKEARKLLMKVDADSEANRALALSKLEQVRPEILKGYTRDFNDYHVKELFIEYRELNPHWTSTYAKTVANIVNQFYNSTDGKKPIRELGPFELHKYLGTFKNKNNAHKHGEKLMMMVKKLWKLKKLASNYFEGCTLPSETPRGEKVMCEDSELGLLMKIDKVVFADAVKALLTTGARENEILKATGLEYDDQHGVIRKENFKTEKKGGMPYRLIPSIIKPMMDARKAKYGAGYLFQNEDGTPYTADQFYYDWNKYKTQLGIPDCRLIHGLRHSFCAACFLKGIIPAVTAALMGHASVKMVLRVYAHLEAKLGKFRPQLDGVWTKLPE